MNREQGSVVDLFSCAGIYGLLRGQHPSKQGSLAEGPERKTALLSINLPCTNS
jgi:hypothetical protein